MEKQQVVALVLAVAMLVATLLDATFTFGELPPPAAAQERSPTTVTTPAAAPQAAPQRVVAQAKAA